MKTDHERPTPTVHDEQREGVRVLVLHTRGAHYCAYLGVPDGHPLAGFDYGAVPLSVHGGLTFAGGFEDRKGWWFYGWDYAHLGDDDVKPERVKEDALAAIYDFRQLAALCEEVSRRASVK